MNHILLISSLFLGHAFADNPAYYAWKFAPLYSKPERIASSTSHSAGREKKAQEGHDYGRSGQGAALGTGIALMADGVPKTMSPLLPVQIEGWTEVAMAGLEFAQMAASGDHASRNKGQENLLRSDYGQTGTQSTGNTNDTSDAIRKQFTPEFVDLLRSNGANPDRFARDLASGKLTDASSIANAMGGDVPDEVLAQADANIHQATKTDFSSPAAPMGNQTLGMNSSTMSGSTQGNGGQVAGASSAGQSQVNADGPSTSETPGTSSTVARADASSSDAMKNSHKLGAGMESLFDAFGKAFETNAQDIIGQLESAGVQVKPPWENIFGMAHRHYRGFGKWRKHTKLALLSE
ncbi:MAG: hypothetical protein HY537_08390 [Deltaproteobacteria bacterium]|nr:hypothetical protein [Deltaproteobacteria bacterium]